MPQDILNSIIPWILLAVGLIWLFSTFKDPIMRFYEWIKGFMGANKNRFQPRATGGITEFRYN
jgi:hypothetical protein